MPVPRKTRTVHRVRLKPDMAAEAPRICDRTWCSVPISVGSPSDDEWDERPQRPGFRALASGKANIEDSADRRR